MDLMLDHKKGRAFNCEVCSAPMQKLRNCSGRGTPGKNLINGKVYARCPRATLLDSPAERYFVALFFESREHHVYPFSGGYAEQSSYFADVFSHLDDLRSKYMEKQHNEQTAKMDKQNAASGSKRA